MRPNYEKITVVVEPEHAGKRLDIFLAEIISQHTRSLFKRLIDDGLVSCNGKIMTKAHYAVAPGDTLVIQVPIGRVIEVEEYEKLGITVVDEREHFLIINKPAGVIVHPAAVTHSVATLTDWLMAHFPETAQIGSPERPGIVHRLDKDTSGLMIIARTLYAYQQLSAMFKQRQMKKVYYAVVEGRLPDHGTIDFPLDRHPVHKQKMTHLMQDGRPALTNYTVITYFPEHAFVQAEPITGRTHQLRVHFAAIGHPITGDEIYGSSSKLINRQALHAFSLAFDFEGKQYAYTQEPPEDFRALLSRLASAK